MFPEGIGAIFKEENLRHRSKDKSGGKLNSKVLETWINETL